MARQSPLDSMESWLEQMSEQFETAAESWGSGFETWSERLDQPQIDLIGDDEEYVIVADVPGYSKDDIDVYVADQTLAIDAEQTEEMEVSERDFIKRERSHESLSRRLSIPRDADTDDISATLEDGVLTVRIRRAEPLDSGHRIDID